MFEEEKGYLCAIRNIYNVLNLGIHQSKLLQNVPAQSSSLLIMSSSYAGLPQTLPNDFRVSFRYLQMSTMHDVKMFVNEVHCCSSIDEPMPIGELQEHEQMAEKALSKSFH